MRNAECKGERRGASDLALQLRIPHSALRIGGGHLQEHHLSVARTARYFTLGEISPGVREVWFVCHGYGQLAGRFLRHFEPLADGTRLLVAPEALSRFYLEGTTGPARERKGGATWMTSEDRLSEIDDYVRYLDALHAEGFARVERGAVTRPLLGFSQAPATACRGSGTGGAS